MSPWLLLPINLVLIVLLWLILRRRIDARTRQHSALDDIKREVGEIITELNQTTERNIELVEDRMRRMRELVADADRRLGALKRQEEATRNAEATYSRLKPPIRIESVEPSDEARTVAAPADGERGVTEAAGATTTGAGGGKSVPATDTATGSDSTSQTVSDASGEEEVPLRERVKTLYLRGLAAERIAAITGRTVGEVELIISLEER